MRVGPKIAVIFAGSLAGCSLFVGLDGLTGGSSASDDGGSDAAPGDAPFDATKDSGPGNVDAGPSCPDGGGPSMVNVGSFCIDSTEVTNAQYQQFLGAASMSLLPPECSFKSGYTSPGSLGDGDDLPVHAVDWCDAYAFCEWAGKRLCGKVGGGPNPYDEYANVNAQWYFACTGGGATIYPYGNEYEPAVCNDNAYDAGTAIAVESASKCVGGFPGLYDMAGNVWEWEDSCETDGGPSSGDQCRCRGGTWVDGEDVTSCGYDSYEHFETRRGDQVGYNGIRCCGP